MGRSIGMLGSHAQQPFLAHATEPDAWLGLQRLRLAARLGDAIVPPMECGRGLGEQPANDLHAFFELIEAFLDGQKRDAIRVELDLAPPRAQAELHATAAQMIDGHHSLRQHRRVSVRHAKHQTAYTGVLRRAGQNRHTRYRLETRPIGVAGNDHRGIEMVPNRNPVKTGTVRKMPDRAELIQCAVLRSRVHAKKNAAHRNARKRG